jgi:hypothetical protein
LNTLADFDDADEAGNDVDGADQSQGDEERIKSKAILNYYFKYLYV